jgi:ribosome-associated protein
MIIVSGNNRTHLGALANHVATYAKKKNLKCHGIEGSAESSWVIFDVGDVILHIFMPETRALYDLESMWLTPTPTVSKKIEKTKA